MSLRFTLICSLSLFMLIIRIAGSVYVRGTGASFPNEVYKKWMPAYQSYRSDHVTVKMTYSAVGSGNGKLAIKKNEDIEYAGSDSLLSATDTYNFSDLVTFPTMAGGVILGYNLPDIKVGNLNLTRDQVVGIYNGTYTRWDDPSIQDINPEVIMPNKSIIVIARADKSGTTNLFTEALSAFSSDWHHKYGTFSKGLNKDTDKPYHWNSDVIRYYGQRNRGVSGLILSLKYSVGYLSVADALEADIVGAVIRNKAGNFVNASTATVQSAMDDFLSRSSSLTFSLADSVDYNSYPIAGFTYFIVYKTWTTRCDSAKELVRYIEFFLTQNDQKEICEKLGMAPLSQSLVRRIKKEVLQTLTCRGQNVWDLVQKDIENEKQVEQTWVTPVAITVPITIILIAVACGYLLWQKVKLMRMLDSDEWHIPIEEILFVHESGKNSNNGSKFTDRSMTSFYSARERAHDDFLIQQILQWPGKWKGVQVGVRLIEVKQLRSLNKPMKQYMLLMKNRLCHNNIVRFFGLTDLDSDMYVVSEYCAKGIITDILQDAKLNLTNDLKCSLSLDIAHGMNYLHSNDILHGHLRSCACLIDARWQVKISDWEYCKLMSVKRAIPTTVFDLHNNLYQDLDTHSSNVKNFWIAPEVIKSEFLLPVSKECDLYSFAITLQEIFSREEPYAEHANELSPAEVLNAVVLNGLRPEYSDETPMTIRQIMEICWSENPVSRPTFEQVIKLLRRAHPEKKTIIDSMMSTMEEYISHLEERIEENNAELKVTNNKLESTLTCLMPPYVALRISKGKSILAERHYKLAMAVVEVGTPDADAKNLNPEEILTFMNEIFFEVEILAKKYSIFLQKAFGCSFYLVSGFENMKINSQNVCDSLINLCCDIIDNKEIGDLLNSVECSSIHLKIGLHMDEAVTGMIGTNAPSFVVFGSLSDVAQALARSCPPYSLHVSQTVWKIAKHQKVFSGCSHGKLSVKERTYNTYLVSRKEKEVSKAPSDDSGLGDVTQDKSIQQSYLRIDFNAQDQSKHISDAKHCRNDETKVFKCKGFYKTSKTKRKIIEDHKHEPIDENYVISMDPSSKCDTVQIPESPKVLQTNFTPIKSIPITKEYVPVKSKWKRTFVSSVHPYK